MSFPAMNNVLLCLPTFSSFDLLDTKLETEDHREKSGLGYCQMGVTTKFLYPCIKLHPNLPVKKKAMI